MFPVLGLSSRWLGRIVLSLGLAALAPAAFGQAATSAVTKVVVPYPAGGISDTVARVITERLARILGQTMIIENRPGAAGRIGIDSVARAPADGTTLLFTNSSYSITPVIDPAAKYDPAKTLAPLAIVGTYGLPVVVATKLPVNNLQELIAYAKKNPGKLSYGSSGMGSGAHFAGEYLKSLTGTYMVHIPYKSTSGATNDVAAGVVDLSFDATAKAQADAGKVKIIAVTGAQRDPRMPQVPTAAESGLKDYVMSSWVGFLAPAGTPPATVKALNQAINTVLAEPAVQKLLNDLGVSPAPNTPAAMEAAIRNELVLYRRIATNANLKVE